MQNRANTAGRCLRDIALETPLILTTGRGKGDNGQPTFFGYNPPFNPSRTEHILMSTALFMCCKQISVLHEFDSADHRPLLCHFFCQCSLPHIDLRVPGHIQKRGKGKHMVWRDEHKDTFVSHMLENENVLQSFRNSIRNQEHQSCYKHFLDSLRLLLMPLVGQQDKCRAEWSWAFPWPLGMTQRAVITKDVSDGTKKTQPTFC